MFRRTYTFQAASVLLAALSSAASLGAEAKTPISPEDILNVRWATSLSLSPDATQVAYVVREPADVADPKSEGKTNLWITGTDKTAVPRLAALGHFDVTRPQWSPDSKRIAFLSKGNRDKRGKQVWLLGPHGDLPTCLTQTSEGVVDYRWSSDSTEIAFISRDASKATNDPIELDRHHGHNRLWVVRVSNAAVHAVTQTDQHVTDMTWSPTGTEFAVVVAPSDDFDEIDAKARLIIIDGTTGMAKRAISDKVAAWMSGLNWSPDGKSIAFFEFTGNTLANRLALVDATGGPPRYLLSDYRGTLFSGGMRWSSDSRQLIVPTFETLRGQLLRVDTGNGSFQRLTESIVNFWDFSLSADGQTIAIGAEDAHSPPDIVVLKVGQKPVKLTDLNPQISALRLGNVSEINWKNKRDGKTIHGALVTPADFNPGHPRKTVVQLHSGPHWFWSKGWEGDWVSWGHMLASHGYVVLLPNPRGSLGQGWEFSDALYRDWGGMDFQDVMDGVDLLVEQRIADPDRMGVGGWSYGGFLSASATTQTDRFKAAIVGASITDLTTLSSTGDMSTGWRRSFGMDAILGRDDLLQRLSPLTHIDRCKTPTLVLHGEKDAMYHGRAWYRGLKLRGVESEMVIYPGAPHMLTERAHQLDLMQRVLAWYDKYLSNE